MNAYIHIPFCRSLCSYCDFTSFAGKDVLLPSYVGALASEIATSDLEGPLRTVYFGGGTPSLLAPRDFSSVMEALKSRAGIEKDAEVTLEANPDTVDLALLRRFREAGVTRLSLGAQSSHPALLRVLSRRHDWGQVERAVCSARGAGISGVNVDLMIGLPGQTLPMVRETLEKTLSLAPEHLSVYALQLEPGTPLEEEAKRGLSMPGDDETADQYGEVQTILAGAGFGQYEVSNWCRPGHECRHNRAVWRGEDYWGFGVSAVGTRGDERREHGEEIEEYVRLAAEGRDPVVRRERVPPRVRAFERIMLGLRTREGVAEAEMELFLASSPSGARARLELFLREGWLIRGKGRIGPGKDGFFRLHALLEALVPEGPGDDAR